MPEMIVRPTPSESERIVFAKGRTRIGPYSASWFSKGGLGVDADGIFLLDADGVRHPIPAPPNAQLVRLTMKGSTGADAYVGLPELFVADEHQYRVAELPAEGFQQTDFSGFARVAGIRWLDLRDRSISAHGRFGGYPSTDQTIDLDGRTLAEADRRQGGLFHRRRPK